MRVQSGLEERKARIELIPLIDVMFLTLVVFIYATLSMVVFRGVRVDLPRGVGAVDRKGVVVIAVHSDNRLSIDGRLVTRVEAVAEAARRTRESQSPVLISGDQRSDLGITVELLSGLRAAGVEAVTFQVKTE